MHPKIDSRVLEKDYGVRRVIEIAGQVLLDAISFENDLFTSKSGLFLSGTLNALIYRSHAPLYAVSFARYPVSQYPEGTWQ